MYQGLKSKMSNLRMSEESLSFLKKNQDNRTSKQPTKEFVSFVSTDDTDEESHDDSSDDILPMPKLSTIAKRTNLHPEIDQAPVGSSFQRANSKKSSNTASLIFQVANGKENREEREEEEEEQEEQEDYEEHEEEEPQKKLKRPTRFHKDSSENIEPKSSSKPNAPRESANQAIPGDTSDVEYRDHSLESRNNGILRGGRRQNFNPDEDRFAAAKPLPTKIFARNAKIPRGSDAENKDEYEIDDVEENLPPARGKGARPKNSTIKKPSNTRVVHQQNASEPEKPTRKRGRPRNSVETGEFSKSNLASPVKTLTIRETRKDNYDNPSDSSERIKTRKIRGNAPVDNSNAPTVGGSPNPVEIDEASLKPVKLDRRKKQPTKTVGNPELDEVHNDPSKKVTNKSRKDRAIDGPHPLMRGRTKQRNQDIPKEPQSDALDKETQQLTSLTKSPVKSFDLLPNAVMVASSPIKSTRSSALNAFANERDAPRSLPQQGNRTSPVKPSHATKELKPDQSSEFDREKDDDTFSRRLVTRDRVNPRSEAQLYNQHETPIKKADTLQLDTDLPSPGRKTRNNGFTTAGCKSSSSVPASASSMELNMSSRTEKRNTSIRTIKNSIGLQHSPKVATPKRIPLKSNPVQDSETENALFEDAPKNIAHLATPRSSRHEVKSTGLKRKCSPSTSADAVVVSGKRNRTRNEDFHNSSTDDRMSIQQLQIQMDTAFAIGRKNMGKSMNPAVFGQQNLPDHIEMIYRFNPYTAPQGDPVRARQLLSTEDYRVSWLHLQPRCIHTMKTYATTMYFLIAGKLEIRIDENRATNLNPELRTLDLESGLLCYLTNTGEDVAIVQITEILERV